MLELLVYSSYNYIKEQNVNVIKIRMTLANGNTILYILIINKFYYKYNNNNI